MSAPSHAISLWMEGGELKLLVPPPAGVERPHLLTLPLAKCGIATTAGGSPLASQRGWLVLLDLLKQRERTKRSARGIGTKADPVQYDLDSMLRALARAKKPKPIQTLEDLGLL